MRVKRNLFFFVLLFTYSIGTAQPVNLFTGDFSYSVPLMNIPSPDGPPIPIGLSYNAGIRMQQKSSFVGLGWSMNIGAISRSTHGVPDDWREEPLTKSVFNANGIYNGASINSKIQNYYGPMYFNKFYDGVLTDTDGDITNHTAMVDIVKQRTMDSYVAYHTEELTSFEFPDYDIFRVSGAGIGGTMKGYWFDRLSLRHNPTIGSKLSLPSQQNMQFRFIGDQNEVNVPSYFDNVSNMKTTYTGYSSMAGTNLISSNNLTFWNPATNSFDISPNHWLSVTTLASVSTNDVYTGAITSGIAHSTKKIEVYTNQEIIDGIASTLIDCYELTMTDRGNRPPDGIGAFVITNEQGYTYHYALPIYQNEETNFVLEYIENTANIWTLDSIRQSERVKYATAWRLTAITGPNYKDLDNNGKVNVGDKGYWVAYGYALWTDDFNWQAPFYGTNKFFNERPTYDDYGNIIRSFKDAKNESISKGNLEIWYPDYIQTASHTAFFVKDIRLDDHSKPTTTGQSPTPRLRLDKIIMLRTEDAGLFTNNFTTNGLSNTNNFSLSDVDAGNMIHVGVYNNNKTNIDNAALAVVDLEQDYSLAKGYHNNINFNPSNNSTQNYITSSNWLKKLDVENIGSGSTSSNTGKLTLKEIKTYGYQLEDKIPPYKFFYSKNYNYNPNNTDYWGYYSSSSSSPSANYYYTDEVSKDEVDTWSLTQIQTPTQGKLLVEYESDKYEYVGKGKPERIFKIDGISNISTNGQNWTVHVDYNTAFDNYKNNLSSLNDIAYTKSKIPIILLNPTPVQGGTPDLHYTLNTISSSATNINNGYLTYLGDFLDLGFDPGLATITTNDKASALIIGLNNAYGGGIRVKSITSENGDGLQFKTKYAYEEGAASVEPARLSPAYAGRLMNNWLLYDRHQFAPNVGYGKVTITSESTTNNNIYSVDAPLRSVHEFYSYNDEEVAPVLLEKKFGQKMTNTLNNYDAFIEQREIVHITDRKSFYVGKTRESITYDQHDNILSKVKNYYKEGAKTSEYVNGSTVSTINQKYIGLMPSGYIYCCNDFNARLLLASAFIKTEATQVLDKQIVYQGGTAVSSIVLERDPVTGIPTQSRRIDPSTGEELITERTMAYLDYPQMGMATTNSNNDNFLTATSKQKIFKDGALVSGSYQTFDKDMMVRKLVGNTYQETLETDKMWHTDKIFAFNGEVNEANWREQAQNTLFDDKGNTLERKGFNDRYSAIKYGYDDQYVLSSLGDGRYAEFTYSGAEDLMSNGLYFGGEVAIGNGIIEYTNIHTGKKSIRLNQGGKGFTYTTTIANGIEAGRVYKASVWIKKGSLNTRPQLVYSFGGTTMFALINPPSTLQVGDWNLVTLEIPIPSSATSGTLEVYCESAIGTSYFDDFRFHPIDEPVTTYVYDPLRGQVEAILNTENFYTRFEYDGMGALFKTYQETVNGEKLVSETTYNYKN